jgi:GTP cyclohydrolase II
MGRFSVTAKASPRRPECFLETESTLVTDNGVFRFLCYRSDEGEEAYAVTMGDLAGGEPALVRVHSECLTGEVFGSLKCDCRDQLEQALQKIGERGRGALVYLRQEGRGIGLGNKIAAYSLQDHGADTVEANVALGFDADLRSYDLAAGILRDLGVTSVRLMTNNPEKIAGLERAGMPVDTQESHWVGATEHSESYLAAKKSKLGHLS